MKKYNKFSNKELWDLDYTIASFILPRLIKFREINKGHPGTFENQEQWNEVLDRMIYSFQYIINNEDELELINDDDVQEGLELFGKYLRNLWI